MRKYNYDVPKEYEYYEFNDRLFNVNVNWYGVDDSIPDRNDLGDYKFISWWIDPQSVAVEELLDDGLTKDITDKKLIDDILDSLSEPEKGDF